MKSNIDIRHQFLSSVKKIVVKIGTGVITDQSGFLEMKQIKGLAEQIVELKKRGYETTVVSSGSIGCGMSELGLKKRPVTLPELQAVAAVGQSKLISVYDAFFKVHGYHAAQILFTRDDFEDRQRYLNTCNTIHMLLRINAIPIVNENDTISVDEIAFGDNDELSALVTNLISADLLIILSSVDGLYEKQPTAKKKPRVVEIVEDISDKIKGLAYDEKTLRGVGGMHTKLKAASIVTHAGECVVIANGRRKDVLTEIMQYENIGTFFLPKKARLASRKRWIGYTKRAKGKIFIDNGAVDALLKKGKSLLASGIVSVEGEYNKGDIVSVCKKENAEVIARGLTNYSSEETNKIKGQSTSHIVKILGYKMYDEVVHRDNMVILIPAGATHTPNGSISR